jgi:hypothetical protein
MLRSIVAERTTLSSGSVRGCWRIVTREREERERGGEKGIRIAPHAVVKAALRMQHRTFRRWFVGFVPDIPKSQRKLGASYKICAT